MSNFVYKKADGSLSVTEFKEGDIHPKFDLHDVINSLYENGDLSRDYEVKKVEYGQPITQIIFCKPSKMFTTTFDTPLDENGEIDSNFDLDVIVKNMIEKDEVPANYVVILKKIDNPVSIIIWQSPTMTSVIDIETPLLTIEQHHDDLKALGLFEGEEFIGYNINVPNDQTFFDAFIWDEKNQQIQIDMTKSRSITLKRLDTERNEQLQELKLDLNVAMALEEIEEKEAIVTTIRALRAANLEQAVADATSIEDLKELRLGSLL